MIQRLGLVTLSLFGVLACSAQSAKQHYALADRLWNERKYEGAVSEYERVLALDPGGALGKQALYRAATTQMLFLGQNADALTLFRRFVAVSQDAAAVWDARVQIGEILFSRLEQYDAAAEHYSQMLTLYPNTPDRPEFELRVAQSYFYLREFEKALKGYAGILRSFPKTKQAEHAAYGVGFALLTKAAGPSQARATQMELYQEAIDALEQFIKRYPNSENAVLARFGVASALEEMDQLTSALQTYYGLKGKYPAPGVVETKIRRIEGRLALQRTKK